MATSKVPKFGAWEGGEENYTVYFDKARNSRQNGPKINPNDPEENPEMFRPNGTWAQAQVQAQPQTRTQAQTQTRTAEKQRKQTNVVPHFGAWENGDATGYTQCFEHVRRARHTGPPPSQNEPRPQARTQTQAQAQNEPQGRTQAQAQAQGRTQAQTQNEPQPQGRTQAQAQTQNEPQPQARTQGQGQGRTQGRPGSREGRGTYVPKFGDWEGEAGGGGYTVVFDNLKNKHNNPNNSNGGPTSQDSRATVPAFGAWDGGDDVQYTTYFDNAGKPRRAEPQPQMINRDVSQGGSSVASQDRQGRPSSVTPATVHPRANRQNQQATTIPNFGGWNNDPSQADRYTKAFEMAKQERQTAVNNNSNNPSSNSYYKQQLYSKQKQQPACCTIL